MKSPNSSNILMLAVFVTYYDPFWERKQFYKIQNELKKSKNNLTPGRYPLQENYPPKNGVIVLLDHFHHLRIFLYREI